MELERKLERLRDERQYLSNYIAKYSERIKIPDVKEILKEIDDEIVEIEQQLEYSKKTSETEPEYSGKDEREDLNDHIYINKISERLRHSPEDEFHMKEGQLLKRIDEDITNNEQQLEYCKIGVFNSFLSKYILENKREFYGYCHEKGRKVEWNSIEDYINIFPKFLREFILQGNHNQTFFGYLHKNGKNVSWKDYMNYLNQS